MVLIAAGFYVPGSPVATVRNQLVAAQQEEKPLESEVASLRVYKQRRAELQSEMDALVEAARDAADHRSGGKAGRSVHPHDSKRGFQFGSFHPPLESFADRSETVLL